MTFVNYIDKASVHRNRYTDKELIMKSVGYDITKHQGHSKNFFHIKTFKTDTPNQVATYPLQLGIARLHSSLEKEYTTFRIPKASGGFRTIEAPSDSLKDIQSKVVRFLQNNYRVLPHGAAYAYTKGRSAYDALVHHQAHDAKWFLKLDIKEFFPSISHELIVESLPKIHPLHDVQRSTLERIADIATNLDGVLPQGSPLSPLLSNLVMVEFDYELTKRLKNFNRKSYTYTRYADDLLITCKYNFKFSDVIELIEEVLTDLSLPFEINNAKTRYASKSGRNWNLGLMYTHDQQITIGQKRKKALHSQVHDFLNEEPPVTEESGKRAQQILGNLAYLRMVEPEYHDKLISKYNKKFNTNTLIELAYYTQDF